MCLMSYPWTTSTTFLFFNRTYTAKCIILYIHFTLVQAGSSCFTLAMVSTILYLKMSVISPFAVAFTVGFIMLVALQSYAHTGSFTTLRKKVFLCIIVWKHVSLFLYQAAVLSKPNKRGTLSSSQCQSCQTEST